MAAGRAHFASMSSRGSRTLLVGGLLSASAAFAPGAAVNRQAAALYEMMRAVNAGEAGAYARVYAQTR